MEGSGEGDGDGGPVPEALAAPAPAPDPAAAAAAADQPAAAAAIRPLSRFDSLERLANLVSGGSTAVMTGAVVLRLAYQSVGVVYGDVGTSPLYVFSSTFPSGISSEPRKQILGALSFIIYTLTLSPLIKYVFLVLRANDNGEGGTFALFTLLCRRLNLGYGTPDEKASLSSYDLPPVIPGGVIRTRIKSCMERSKALQIFLLLLTFMGTCMVIGDGTITPSISVISAVQGIQVQAPKLTQNIVVIISVAILILLFNVQRFGTDKVGFLFAPVLVIWFLFIAAIGLFNVVTKDIGVLRAFNPWYMVEYMKLRGKDGFISLGGIVLCITGTEAMFADLGHFSVRSIQVAFTTFVYPSLLLAYCGQAAHLLKHPDDVGNAFYKSVPQPVYWPMLVVAVLAAIIASQAMISAVFQIIKQSQAMSCFPRVKVVHTSKRFPGQVYIPEMNWFLMLACVIISVIFKNTTTLGNAYGICVVSVMFLTTFFTSIIMLLLWDTSLALVLGYFVFYSAVELTYFSSVLVKFKDGGWIPMLFAGSFLSIMATWSYGSSRRQKYEVRNKMSVEWMCGLLSGKKIVRVEGAGLIYTSVSQGIPALFSHYVSTVPALHSVLVFVTIKNLPVSNVLAEERFLFKRLGERETRMYRCIARYGYRDVHRGDAEFEKSLFESLDRFIGSGIPLAAPVGAAEDHPADSVSIAVYPEQKGVIPEGSSGEAEGEEVVRKVMEVEEELGFVKKSREAGVVYVLGHTEVVAHRDSGLINRFLINHVYYVLRRNSRESRLTLEVPHRKLLKIGNVVYL